MLTVEDIAEELVGEITDEHDPEGTDQLRSSAGAWTVPGSLHVQEVERLVDLDLPEGDYQTVGGPDHQRAGPAARARRRRHPGPAPPARRRRHRGRAAPHGPLGGPPGTGHRRGAQAHRAGGGVVTRLEPGRRRRRRGRPRRAERVLRRGRVRPGRGAPLPAGGGRGDQRRRSRRAAQRPRPLAAARRLPAGHHAVHAGARRRREARRARPAPPRVHGLGPARRHRGRRRVRRGAGRGDLRAPGHRRDGPEVVGDRAPGTLGDPARAADAGLHGRHPAVARGAQRAGERLPAAGRRGAGGRGGRRPATRTACASWSPTPRRPARWTANGTTGWSRRWTWKPRRWARWSGRTPR